MGMEKCQNQGHMDRHSKPLHEPKAKILRCRGHCRGSSMASALHNHHAADVYLKYHTVSYAVNMSMHQQL